MAAQPRNLFAHSSPGAMLTGGMRFVIGGPLEVRRMASDDYEFSVKLGKDVSRHSGRLPTSIASSATMRA